LLYRIIDLSLGYRWIVLAAAAVLIGLGAYTMSNIPIEAFPDLTNTICHRKGELSCVWEKSEREGLFGGAR
jgi:Cu/Ag efflux pump CusA